MKRYKYPRTYHLPWSEGASSDDKTHSLSKIAEMFANQEVVVTENGWRKQHHLSRRLYPCSEY